MRISIRKHNQAYLQELASQMGIADISEVLNYLLLDIKGLGYSFGNKLQPQPQQPQIPIGYNFDPSTFETNQNHINHIEPIDPIISRLANFIEEF